MPCSCVVSRGASRASSSSSRRPREGRGPGERSWTSLSLAGRGPGRGPAGPLAGSLLAPAQLFLGCGEPGVAREADSEAGQHLARLVEEALLHEEGRLRQLLAEPLVGRLVTGRDLPFVLPRRRGRPTGERAGLAGRGGLVSNRVVSGRVVAGPSCAGRAEGKGIDRKRDGGEGRRPGQGGAWPGRRAQLGIELGRRWGRWPRHVAKGDLVGVGRDLGLRAGVVRLAGAGSASTAALVVRSVLARRLGPHPTRHDGCSGLFVVGEGLEVGDLDDLGLVDELLGCLHLHQQVALVSGRLRLGLGARRGLDHGVLVERPRPLMRGRPAGPGPRQRRQQRVLRRHLAQLLQGGRRALLQPARPRRAHHVLGLLAGAGGVVAQHAQAQRLLARLQVVRVELEDLAQVLQRLLVQAVLHVDVGLGEELGDGLRPERPRRRRRRARRGWRGGARGEGGAGGRPEGHRARLAGRRGRAAREREGGRGASQRHRGWRTGQRDGGRRARERGGGRARRGKGARGLQRLLVVGRELEHAPPGAAGLVGASLRGVEVGQLAVDRHRLGVLAQVAEGLRQQGERVEVLGVGLERELELGERALGVALGQVDVGQLAGEGEVLGVEEGDPLRDLQPLLGAVGAPQRLRGAPELQEGGHAVFPPRVQLPQLDRGRHVVGLELGHPLQHAEQLGLVAVALGRRGHHLQLGHGVGEDAELLVERGQPLVHPHVVGRQLEHLLEDGDGLEEEALVGVGVGDAAEGGGGAGGVTLLLLELADLEEDADVLRILGQDLLVRADGLVELALLDQLGRVGGDLVLVDSHRPERAPRASRGAARRADVSRAKSRASGLRPVNERSVTVRGGQVARGRADPGLIRRRG